jgi:hypothetical protein
MVPKAKINLKKKEEGWSEVGFAISRYNEIVHPNFKLTFEKL